MRSSELTPYTGKPWRCVEHQATIATMNLVHGDMRKHDILEAYLEAHKPPLPNEAEGLHWLAATPFRYQRARASRWGRAGLRGVWYGAATQEVALRECIFHRRAFFDAYDGDKPYTLQMSLIQARVKTLLAVDFTDSKYNRIRKRIEDPDSYDACHKKADEAIKAGAEVIRYNSTRTPPSVKNRECVAILSPAAFASPAIICEGKTVSLSIDEKDVQAYFNASRTSLVFTQASLDWQKPAARVRR